ncbi:MAG: glucosidase [Candidatus Bathyarchaeota archaeon]|nr:glucosidase [Candidatus Bathyarchaeota archaeon]
MSTERDRLIQAREEHVPWRKWGPYLSERQWGTVREDYSNDGSAWDYFSHDQSRSRAYHWGEDGIAGISDDKQYLCFSVALWNGKDPILKERLFGLTNSEGNHGEDVKEYYFYLDSTPTHSYMKYLYKYPQNAYPYLDLVNTNRSRSRFDLEYELLDTGIFNQDKYFDVYVEYAKESPEEILIQITAFNRGNEDATLNILPTLWFRNIWYGSKVPMERPTICEIESVPMPNVSAVEAEHQFLGKRYLYCAAQAPLLFTENENNNKRLFGTTNLTPYVKDGINNFVVNKDYSAVNPIHIGTKASANYELTIPAKQSRTVKLKLTDRAPEKLGDQDLFDEGFDETFEERRREADIFYDSLSPKALTDDERNVLRQALSGLLWSKQYYEYDLSKWLNEHQVDYYTEQKDIRNINWFHMVNSDVISMPDKWEYPWYAAWDLAFHTIAISMVDPDFAKQQLNLMLNERYLHPNGQFPAYEWNFNDVNPPVHAWAVIFNNNLEQALHGKSDMVFLENSFQKLLMNFTWWVNRKDNAGNNIFQGGFLGLDNIGLFDRSAKFPAGVTLDQADGTAWMAMFCQNMLTLSTILAQDNQAYEEQAIKFFEHFLWIAHAMNSGSEKRLGLWDEEDGFYYDILRHTDGRQVRLKVRSMVGLISLCANSVFNADAVEKMPHFLERVTWFVQNHPELVAHIHRPGLRGVNNTFLLSLLTDDQLRRILARMLDENEFLSPHGIRSLSHVYADNPYDVTLGEQSFSIQYAPAESTTGAFGGNSNWRGPVWFPINALIIRALINLYAYYGDDFKVECPTGSGKEMNLLQVSGEIARRLGTIFLRDSNGKRPVYGGSEKFQTDPNWKDNILFYEYFHGDNGAGLGASHQTGWTGLVAVLYKLYGSAPGGFRGEKQGQELMFKRLANQ